MNWHCDLCAIQKDSNAPCTCAVIFSILESQLALAREGLEKIATNCTHCAIHKRIAQQTLAKLAETAK